MKNRFSRMYVAAVGVGVFIGLFGIVFVADNARPRHRVPTPSLTPSVYTTTLEPWVVNTYPYNGLVEPRKDRP